MATVSQHFTDGETELQLKLTSRGHKPVNGGEHSNASSFFFSYTYILLVSIEFIGVTLVNNII